MNSTPKLSKKYMFNRFGMCCRLDSSVSVMKISTKDLRELYRNHLSENVWGVFMAQLAEGLWV